MKVINYGPNFEIYSDDLKTFNSLPPATYKVAFNPMSGFSLVQADNFETIEEKIYGNHLQKIEKVLKSYDQFKRSLGVILSGEKGMGKSLFVQLLAKKAIEKGLPVVIVSKPFPGVADFIEKIDQEALVIFDEFEKVFTIDSDKAENQNDLLGLFDGTSQKKRLYAITVNKLQRVSEFMVSRTGRFHYHIRFDYPDATEIEIYLKDKLEPSYYSEINSVIAFATRVKLNYDSLRAIAFELNQGYSFGEAIADLNILTTDRQRYNVKALFTNGRTEEVKNVTLNLFEESVQIDLYPNGHDWVSLTFDTNSIQSQTFKMMVDGEDIEIELGENNNVYIDDVDVVSLTITHHEDSGVNYKLAY